MQALTTLTQRIALLNRHDVHAAAQSPPGNEKEAVVSWLAYGGREARKYLMRRDSLSTLASVLKARLAFQIANLVFVE